MSAPWPWPSAESEIGREAARAAFAFARISTSADVAVCAIAFQVSSPAPLRCARRRAGRSGVPAGSMGDWRARLPLSQGSPASRGAIDQPGRRVRLADLADGERRLGRHLPHQRAQVWALAVDQRAAVLHGMKPERARLSSPTLVSGPLLAVEITSSLLVGLLCSELASAG